jgi:hypothetical protein
LNLPQSFPSRLKTWLFNRKTIEILFFAAFLVVGLSIYRDFGLHWDSFSQTYIGEINYRYIASRDPALLTFKNRYYGPAFEVFLYLITRGLPERELFFTRHLAIFLTFYLGVFSFYLLVKKIFGNWKVALLGSLFLILSPRIFADGFYNSKDIPFLSVFILAVYTLIRYLDQKTFRNAAVHALICALLVALRLPGMLILGLTLGFLLLDILFQPQSHLKKYWLLTGLMYIGLVSGLVILFWPVLWHDPSGELVKAFQQMSNFPWLGGALLYRGQLLDAKNLPWHYIPVWILITTPLMYLFWLAVGVARQSFYFVFGAGKIISPEKRNFLLIAAWLLTPIAVVIVLHSTLYDGWRQLFFVYPALLLLGLYGVQVAFSLRLPQIPGRIIQGAILLLLLAGLFDPFSFMVRNHPNENVYFNRLAGKTMRSVKAAYELDYWGLSYRQGLEWVLAHDPSEAVRVYVANVPGKHNAALIAEDQRKRLVYVDTPQEATYFITNYRWHPQPYDYPNEVFSVKIDEVSILSVFKLQ